MSARQGLDEELAAVVLWAALKVLAAEEWVGSAAQEECWGIPGIHWHNLQDYTFAVAVEVAHSAPLA